MSTPPVGCELRAGWELGLFYFPLRLQKNTKKTKQNDNKQALLGLSPCNALGFLQVAGRFTQRKLVTEIRRAIFIAFPSHIHDSGDDYWPKYDSAKNKQIKKQTDKKQNKTQTEALVALGTKQNNNNNTKEKRKLLIEQRICYQKKN